MKDNGDNDLLIMDGYLSESELKTNLPSNVASSNVRNSGMGLCLHGEGSNISETNFLATVNNYCYNYWNNPNDKWKNYTWNNSIVKPTLEKWLTSKMTANELYSDIELKSMAFSDGDENSTGYIRLLQTSDFSTNKISDGGACQYANYCPISDTFAIRSYSYWTMTTKIVNSNDYSNSVYYNGKNVNYTSSVNYPSNSGKIVPVITVNEK